MSDSNGLIKDLMERHTGSMKQKCSYTRIKENLPADEAEAVENAEKAIKTDSGNGRAKIYSCTWLSEILTKNGYPVSSSTISRHMNGRCGCE